MIDRISSNPIDMLHKWHTSACQRVCSNTRIRTQAELLLGYTGAFSTSPCCHLQLMEVHCSVGIPSSFLHQQQANHLKLPRGRHSQSTNQNKPAGTTVNPHQIRSAAPRSLNHTRPFIPSKD
ncbi:hypothetical protein Nepgr_017362 [Nepenthes gracilis]|uniref:Uncharacterized protein n=1 Tax=Nepenthes gracilis TaxID=150966 RepID=A0AAD3SRW2_NEPGR|nr:hypothetical protein Nepgr_017362 [Nepenthes gracilis]